ncbi:MAG: hypothetical protein LBG45_10350 [Dysgonamonadaceae bacterium]|jgi:hypothetical protein|nr:hypothetical protein [Dysgonamonadaceae bacterium]
MIKKDFSIEIDKFRSKSNQEKLAFLSKFWKFDINCEPFKLIGTYKKSEKPDKNSKEYGFFIDVRNTNGDILYYPFNLGQVRIWVEHRENLLNQAFWLFDVAFSKKNGNNPFQLNLANKTFRKPSKTVLDKIDAEKNIGNILSDEKEEKNTTETHSLQENNIQNNMNKTVRQEPDSVRKAKSKVFHKMYVANVHNRLRQLNEPTENDCKRWIWELIQNAKDSISQDPNRDTVDIKVEVNDDRVIFKHNGSPFTADAQQALLYKYSEGKEDSESTGRFGTGFLTTHTLSKIVSIDGPLYNDDSCQSVCGFSTTMYRDGLDESDLLDGLTKMENSMKYFDNSDGWTTYTYYLKTPQNKNALELGVKNFISNIAQVMLFCKELKTVELYNGGVKTQIIRKGSKSLSDNIFLSEFEIISENNHARRFIHKYLEKHSDELSSRFKKDRNLRLMVAIEIDNENNLVDNENAPSHFCVLPLVGSEKHIIPIYLNSPDFEPNSERESLILIGEDMLADKEVISEGGINRLILKESIELYDSLVAYLSENDYKKLFLLAKGLKSTPDFEKNFNKDWFENEMILPYREVLKKYAIVETESENQKLFNNDNTPNIIIPQGNKEVRQKIYSLATELFTNHLPLEKYANDWAMFAWKECGLFGINDLCEYVSDRQNASNLPSYNWLNKFLQFIKETDETLLKKYALVPNSNGDLVSLETSDFAEGVGLTEFMLDTLLALGVDLKPSLLNSNITAIHLPIKVDAKSIAEKIDEQADIIIKDKNLTIEKIVENLLTLININLSDNSIYDAEFIEKQRQINAYVRIVYDTLQFETIKNNDIPAKAWSATHKWLISQLMHSVSGYKDVDSLPDQINDKLQWLNDFIAFASKEIKEGTLDEVAIIPNQNGDFCLKKDLSLDNNIPEILKTEQAEKFGLLLKGSLLHKEITSVRISNKKDINTVIELINDIFRNNSNLDFAVYLIHLLPDKSSNILHNSQNKLLELVQKYDYEICDSYTVSIIQCSNEDLWRKANNVIIDNYQSRIEDNATIEGLKNYLSEQSGKKYDFGDTVIFLNDFYGYLTSMKIPIESNIIPNQNGNFCSLDDLHKDDNIPDELKAVLFLIDSENDFKNILAEKSLSIQPKQNKGVSDIAKLIDEAIKDKFADSRNWDDEDFKKAVALLIEYFKKHKNNEENFSYFYGKKDSIELNVLLSEKDREIIQSYLKGELGLEQVKQKDKEIENLKEENKKLKTKNEELEKLLAEKEQIEKEKTALEKQLKELEQNNPDSPEIAIIQGEIRRKDNEITAREDAVIAVDYGDSISVNDQIEANREAKQVVKERLEEEGFAFTKGIDGYSTIDGVMKDDIEYPLVVKSYKYQDAPLKIGANEWMQLMKTNSMFWVHFGNRKLGCLKLFDLLKKQDKLSISFSTENLDFENRLENFAELLHYFSDVHFDLNSIRQDNYSTAANLNDYRFDQRNTETDLSSDDGNLL